MIDFGILGIAFPAACLCYFKALSQMEHFMCTCGLMDLQWPLRVR